MIDRDRGDAAAGTLHRVARGELADLDRKGVAIDAQMDRRFQERGRRGRAEELERRLAALHAQRPEKAQQPEVVVGVKMREEDRVHREPGAVAHHLALAALAAVEQQELAGAPHRQAREISSQRRLGCRGP